MVYFEDEIFFDDIQPTQSEAGEAFVFLHGFQGRRTKNIDLAKKLSSEFGARCFVPHYRGLGKSRGRFSFVECIQEMKRFVEFARVQSSQERVSLVCHSFGGVVGLNLLEQLPTKIDRVILLGPLLYPPKDPEFLDRLVDDFIGDQAKLGIHYDPEALKSNTHELERRFPCRIATDLKPPPRGTYLIHGRQDDVIPVEESQEFVRSASQLKIQYSDVEDDHWFFQDRAGMVSQVMKWVRNS